MNTIHSGILAIVMSVFLIRATDPPQDDHTGTPSHLEHLPYQTKNFLKFALTNVENGSPQIKDLELRNSTNSENQQPAHYTIEDDTSGKTENTSRYDIITTGFLPQESKSDYEKLLESDFIRPLLELYKNSSNYSLINISNVNPENSSRDLSNGDDVYILHTLSNQELNKLYEKYSKVLNINEDIHENYKTRIPEEIERRSDEGVDISQKQVEVNDSVNNKKLENGTEIADLKTVLEDVGFNQIYVLTKDDFEDLLRNSKTLDIVYESEFRNNQFAEGESNANLEESTVTSTETNIDNPQGRISKEDNIDEMKHLSKADLDTLANHPTLFQNPFDVAEKGVQEDLKVSEEKSSSNVNGNVDLITADTTDHLSIRRDDNGLIDINPQNEHIGEILPENYDITEDKFAMGNQQFSARRRNHLAYSDALYRKSRKSYDFDELYRYADPRFRKVRFRPDYAASSMGADVFEPVSFPDDQSYRYRDQREAYSASDENRMYARPSRYNFVSSEASVRFPQRQRYRDGFYESKEKDTKAPWRGLAYGRKPRVIFPSDIVAFRESNQEEPDYLTADSNLQDIQQQDTRDRGEYTPPLTLFFSSFLISSSP